MSKYLKHIWCKACLILVLSFLSPTDSKAQFYDGYGQNNVQYDFLEWKNLDTSHFRVFYYGRAKNLAVLATNIAEDVSAKLVERLKLYIDFKSNLILYTNYNHYKQSNIHKLNNEIILENGQGISLTGKTYVVYYDGELNHLKKQIEENIIRGFVENAVFGDFLRNLQRNSFAVDIPYWFTEGLIKYVADSISVKDIKKLESYEMEHSETNLFRMAKDEPLLAGKFFWNMIYQKIGDREALKLLNKSVSTKSYYKALRGALNVKRYRMINNEWKKHVDQLLERYNKTIIRPDTNSSLLSIEAPRVEDLSNFSASPLKDEMLYVKKSKNSWELKALNTYGKESTILSGPRTKYGLQRDPHNPKLAWSNNGQVLGILYQDRARYTLKYYNSLDRSLFTRYIKSKLFDRVLSASFTESNNNMLLSVIKNDRSDIVLYTINTNRVQKITDDDFVDLEPVYLYSKLRKGLVWKSNRDNPSMKSSRNRDGDFQDYTYNIFYKDAQNLSSQAQQLTFYKKSMVSNITQFSDNAFSYFIDSNNVRYRMVLEFVKRDNDVDTFRIYELPTPEYPLDQQYIRHTKQAVMFGYDQGRVHMYKESPEISLQDTLYQSIVDEQRQIQDSIMMASVKIEPPIDETKFGNYFMSEFYDESSLGQIQNYTEYDSISYPNRKRRLKITGYEPNFYLDQSGLDFSNELLVTKYQDVNTNGGSMYNIPLSEMYTATITDVLRDYTIIGGVRINLLEPGSDVYATFINRKRFLDWSVTGYRKSYHREDQGKVLTYYFEPTLTYPFSDLNRVSLTLGGRADIYRPFISGDSIISSQEPIDNRLLSARVEYTYDDTYVPEINIRKGQRVTLTTEYFRNIRNSEASLNVAADARAYVPVHKNIIWANRLSLASSFGNSRILYYLGGTDNAISTVSVRDALSSNGSSSLNNQFTSTSPDYNYILQTRAAPLRGFKQNRRNGSGYFLFNTELRVPFISTFMRRPVNSPLLRSLQLVLFTDVGLTWNGDFPNSENTVNSYTLQPVAPGQPTMVIKDPYSAPPVGFGAGLRAEFWGTYTKVDFAWKSQNIVPSPLIHLSLGYDF